jgi:hypothetical protein
VPQSLVFYSMIWNYYRKLLQFLEKSFFSRFEHRKNGNFCLRLKIRRQ